MNNTLGKAAMRGVTWVGAANILAQGLRFVSTIVLARLLLPEDFGIVALSATFTTLLSDLVDVGFTRALIQRKELSSGIMSSTFWLMWGSGIFFFLLTVGLSPFLAGFFSNELVGPVLIVSSFSFVITPLGSVHGAMLRRNLDFFKFSICESGTVFTYVVTAILMAIAGFGLWSIVLAGLTSAFSEVVLRWFFYRWRPSLAFSLDNLKDVWRFGFSVTGIRFVEYLERRADYIITGRFLNSAAVGFYNLGLKTASMPLETLNYVMLRVGFPTFSKMQDDDTRLRPLFLKSISYISIIGLPFFTGMVLVAPDFVRIAYGEQWTPAILPLQLLCVSAATGAVSSGVQPVILSKGRPDIYLKLTIAKVVLLIPVLLIGVRFGTVGVALGVTVVSSIFSVIRQIFANRLVGLRTTEYVASLRPAALGCVVMTAFILVFRYIANSTTLPVIGLLIGSILLGAASYFGALIVTKAKALGEMIELITEMARHRGGLVKTITPIQK